MQGLRIHLAGSAALDCDPALLNAAHRFVEHFVEEAIARGAGLVLQVGGEPRGEADEPCIFDWTALSVVAASPDPAPEWPSLRPERFVAVGSQHGVEKVPDSRREVWDKCRTRHDFDLRTTPQGWRMAGVIREEQVVWGDVLAVLGGGAGVEHLAELYQDEGKPVVPISADIGALNNDGNGGSAYLYGRAMSEIELFLRLRDGSGSSTARLSTLTLAEASDVEQVARDAANLIADLRPRPAFYVRLLDIEHPDFERVERFFRDVVDSVVERQGFTPKEMGRGKPEAAFMNVEIFEALHRAGLVLVDLTGVRPNCMMELGYALARRRRIVISAMAGTRLPFDADKLATYFWSDEGTLEERLAAYEDWVNRKQYLPPLVR